MLQQSAGTPLASGSLVSYTLSAVSTAGEIIDGVGKPIIVARNGGAGLHQVWTPVTNASTPTHQEQLSASLLWSDTWRPDDSYFFFDAMNSLSIGGQFTETIGANPGVALPSAGFGAPHTGFGIYGYTGAMPAKAFTVASGRQGTSVDFAQLVLKQGESVLVGMEILTTEGLTPDFEGFCVGACGGLLTIDPALAIAGAFPALLIEQQFDALLDGAPTTADSWTISSFTKDGVPVTPANPPSISPTGLFSWLPTLADIGPDGLDLQWQAVIQAAQGALTANATLNIVLIPEPSTVLLLGLALTTALGFIRRRYAE